MDWHLMWNNGPCWNAYKVQLINHSNHSCLVLELETSCDMRYHLGPLYHMRFFNGNFIIWVHQTTLVFWAHYSTWVFKKYGSIKPGIFSHVFWWTHFLFFLLKIWCGLMDPKNWCGLMDLNSHVVWWTLQVHQTTFVPIFLHLRIESIGPVGLNIL